MGVFQFHILGRFQKISHTIMDRETALSDNPMCKIHWHWAVSSVDDRVCPWSIWRILNVWWCVSVSERVSGWVSVSEVQSKPLDFEQRKMNEKKGR